MAHMKIGELAEQGQVNLQTIRHYEREGLLPKPPRLASGYRVFSSHAVRRVRFIKRARELGFSLKDHVAQTPRLVAAMITSMSKAEPELR